MRRSHLLLVCLAGSCLGLAPVVAAQESEPEGCATCHGDPATAKPPGVPHEVLKDSVHGAFDCTYCHESISLDTVDPDAESPHGDDVEPVDCGSCHEEEVDTYVKHGRLEIGKDPDLPECWDCHGAHDILPSSNPNSHAHPVNLPDTCRTCHANVDLVAKHDPLREGPIKLYDASVHGQASKRGLYVAATCNDCHSSPEDGKRTAHRILSPADPESTIYHFNIPNTCGQCHKSVTRDYWDGIHGQFVKRGSVDSPVCTNCHGEHGILRHDDPASPVSSARVAETTCAPCHESVVLNEKYGVPAGRLRSYIDSYHGLKAKAGDVHVANCASCHGAHRILPHTDPTSSIHPDNLRDTCGDCHPGISAELASVPIHGTATGIKTGWPRFFTILYLWLIAVTIGAMLLHNIADWVRHLKLYRKKPFVIRLSANEVVQHWALMLSFIVLVISGFALRFSEAWWVQMLFGWGGGEGFLIRGTIHRVAAVIFIVCCVWHLFYLFGARGRRWLRDMLASKRDLVNIKENVQFFLGQKDEKPRFGRFTYMEKCEYWAVVWGGVIMTVTGILLWFDNFFVRSWALPKGILDVALVIHYYEAWLATLAIFVWHIYHTIFSPGVYPMNPAWWSGRMPKDMYTHEHSEGPRLKARVLRERYEDEEETEPRRQPVAQPRSEATPETEAGPGWAGGSSES